MIEIYDTTLRDGSQRKDISYSCEDKLRIARRLDQLGVAYIEGGWPGSNPKDAEFFTRAAREPWKTAVIAAFGSTRRAGLRPEQDANLKALIDAETRVCTVVGKTWTLHVTNVLQTTLQENLALIEDSLAFLKSAGRDVIYDAEHFFDGFRADPDYALATLKAAVAGGAGRLVLCDTNGGSLPHEIEAGVRAAREAAGPAVRLGIHAHNDSELAVANSLAGIRAGCEHVQGTINGYGERCGNANLCAIIPNLILKMELECLPQAESLASLTDLSHFVAEIANLSPDEHAAYTGRAAFAHKGGIHVAAMRRDTRSYQHIEPEKVGNAMQVVVSELSGRGNLLSKAEEHGVKLATDEAGSVLGEIKRLEANGFSFDAAEASVVMLMRRAAPGYVAPFELIDFSSIVEHRTGRGIFAEAMVKVRVGEEVFHTAAEGNGPVAALDTALRKALKTHFPQIEGFSLEDYKVRILDSDSGTAATTRVLIDSRWDGHTWSTVGASPNIIEASWRALADSYEYGLMLVS